MDGRLVRIVTMTFEDRRTEEFLGLFDEVSNRIRSFPGCRHLELLRDRDEPTVFATYSLWDSAESLDAYRSSDLFRETWEKTKAMFSEAPLARSYRLVHPEAGDRTDPV